MDIAFFFFLQLTSLCLILPYSTLLYELLISWKVLGCFQLLSIINKTSVKNLSASFCINVCPTCLDECQGAQSLDHTVRTYPAMSETAGWSLKALVTPYISTSNERRAPVASGLSQRLVLLVFWSLTIIVDPVLVPRDRMKSSFPYTFLLFIHFLWWDVPLDLILSFKLGYLLFSYWASKVLYILSIGLLSVMFCKYFLSVPSILTPLSFQRKWRS